MPQTGWMTATTPPANVYQPGVCNIGPAEIRKRRVTGVIGVVVAVVFLVLAFALGWPAWARLFVMIPVGAATAGFLQGAFHFCVRFGAAGLFNFGELGSPKEEVWQAEYRRKDQRKALVIAGLTALITAVVTVAVYLVPLP